MKSRNEYTFRNGRLFVLITKKKLFTTRCALNYVNGERLILETGGAYKFKSFSKALLSLSQLRGMLREILR